DRAAPIDSPDASGDGTRMAYVLIDKPRPHVSVVTLNRPRADERDVVRHRRSAPRRPGAGRGGQRHVGSRTHRSRARVLRRPRPGGRFLVVAVAQERRRGVAIPDSPRAMSRAWRAPDEHRRRQAIESQATGLTYGSAGVRRRRARANDMS